MAKKLPSQKILKQLFSYNKFTGKLTWNALKGIDGRPNTQWVGQETGQVMGDGYRYLDFMGKRRLVHRVIWKWMTGKDPIDEIDHKNNNRSDNRWKNLRETDHSCNNHNVPCKSHNSSGIKGVKQTESGKWNAVIRKNDIQYFLGSFPTAKLAISAHALAAKRFYGKMARPN